MARGAANQYLLGIKVVGLRDFEEQSRKIELLIVDSSIVE